MQKNKDLNKLIVWLSVLLLLLVLNTNRVQAQCSNSIAYNDSITLVNLFNANAGNSWSVNDGWLSSPVAEWYGVSLITLGDSCYVDSLVLKDNNLTGNILDLALPNLTVLDLSYNLLLGEIPDFSGIPNAIVVDINRNDFTGTIPDFSNIPNVEILHLEGNDLAGTIPDFSNIANLRELHLQANDLTGTIPDFSNIPNVTTLYLDDNELTGSVPDFSNIAQVNWLNLAANQLTGTIPDFSNIPNVWWLYLRDNQLSGTIPDFSNMPIVEGLYLQRNNLTGTIPNFTSVPILSDLALNQNQISGEIPNFDNMPVLSYLFMHGNDLTGPVPDFNNCPKIISFWAYDNQLTGSIPNFQMDTIRSVWLFNNELSGQVPDFSGMPSLESLQIHDNNLTGILPNFTNLPVLEVLIVSDNNLTSTLPNFTNLPALEVLIVCENNFFGTVPNLLGCPALYVADTLQVDLSCIKSAKVQGKIFYDENNNCTYEQSETTVPNGLIVINEGDDYGFVDYKGDFTLGLDTGTYMITYVPGNYIWTQDCLPELESYIIEIDAETFEAEDTIFNIDFANASLVDCPLMKVDVATALQRICSTNLYTVQYCNEGSVVANDAYLELVFGQNIFVLDVTLPYTQTDSIYTFNLGNVGAGECNNFIITDSIACDAPLGSAACVTANIYPQTICNTPNPTWDGADLKVTGYCLGSTVKFEIENLGADMQTPTQYRMYEDDVLVTVDDIEFLAGQKEELFLPTNGNGIAYRLVAEQTEGHPYQTEAQSVIELCGLSPFSLGFVTSQGLSDEAPFMDISCVEILGPYDPNDKIATPKGIGPNHFIKVGEPLDYKIRFQNTGNDTAFQVILVDTLDTEHLDITSLRVLNSSHPYELTIADASVLIFTFDNILLPDSTTNEAASHGFVKYYIEQQANNVVNTVINNAASIYFDYNQAIVTPTAFNTLWNPHYPTSASIPHDPIYNVPHNPTLAESPTVPHNPTLWEDTDVPILIGGQLVSGVEQSVDENALGETLLGKTIVSANISTYPNPATDKVCISIDDLAWEMNKQMLSIVFFDMLGQQVLAKENLHQQTYLEVSHLSSGIYIYKVQAAGNLISSGKISLQK